MAGNLGGEKRGRRGWHGQGASNTPRGTGELEPELETGY